MKRYPVLQSGFVSLTEVGMNSPKLEATSFSEAILGQQSDNTLADYFFSVEVENLISEWKNYLHVTRPLEYRERIVRAAFKCFDCIAISQWTELQNLRPTLGRMHREFLTDTFMFVLYGRPRSVEVLQWARLLFPESGNSYSFKMGSLLTSDTKRYPDVNPRDLEITSLLCLWLQRPDGYIDMLKTLHVIFGRRSAAMSTNRALQT